MGRLKDQFVSQLQKEIFFWKSGRDKKIDVSGLNFETLYLGGGTPSNLSLSQVEKILLALDGFPYSSAYDLKEFTFECNPEDISKEYLEGLQSLGVTKISLGIQCLSESGLRLLERITTVKEGKEAIKLAVKIGFPVVSCDLVFARPRQTVANVKCEINELLKSDINHLSIYQLTLQRNHKLFKDLPDENFMAEMFMEIHNTLEEHKWFHYEISNFSKKPEWESSHNLTYWQMEPYLGFGPGAHSRIDSLRFSNEKSIKQYLEKNFDSDYFERLYQWEKITQEGIFFEYLIGALRLSSGISPKDQPVNSMLYQKEFLERWRLITEKCLEAGWLAKRGNRLHVTKYGMLFNDSLLSEFSILGDYF